MENHYSTALQHADISKRSGVRGPACSGQPALSAREPAFAGSTWMWQMSVIARLTDAQMFLSIRHMPNCTVGLITHLNTKCLNLFVDPSVMSAALEEAPVSTRASKRYHNAKIKLFGDFLLNPDRFFNQK